MVKIPVPKKLDFNKRLPVVLGNFDNGKKGGMYIPSLKKELENEFEIRYLKVSPNRNVDVHNSQKIEKYMEADIFLHYSTSEGYGYSTIDAFNCGLLIVGTNTGLLYDIEKENSDQKIAVIFDWKKMSDIKFVADQIRKCWREGEQMNGKSREWFENNATLDIWKNKIKKEI